MIAIHSRYGKCETLSTEDKFTIVRIGKPDGKYDVKRVNSRLLFYPLQYMYAKTIEFRKYAKEIERLKNDIHNALSESNRLKWITMNSQQKKIAVFRAMELGFIGWKVGSRTKSSAN